MGFRFDLCGRDAYRIQVPKASSALPDYFIITTSVVPKENTITYLCKVYKVTLCYFGSRERREPLRLRRR